MSSLYKKIGEIHRKSKRVLKPLQILTQRHIKNKSKKKNSATKIIVPSFSFLAILWVFTFLRPIGKLYTRSSFGKGFRWDFW